MASRFSAHEKELARTALAADTRAHGFWLRFAQAMSKKYGTIVQLQKHVSEIRELLYSLLPKAKRDAIKDLAPKGSLRSSTLNYISSTLYNIKRYAFPDGHKKACASDEMDEEGPEEDDVEGGTPAGLTCKFYCVSWNVLSLQYRPRHSVQP
jgi:hypothetical protein